MKQEIEKEGLQESQEIETGEMVWEEGGRRPVRFYKLLEEGRRQSRVPVELSRCFGCEGAGELIEEWEAIRGQRGRKLGWEMDALIQEWRMGRLGDLSTTLDMAAEGEAEAVEALRCWLGAEKTREVILNWALTTRIIR